MEQQLGNIQDITMTEHAMQRLKQRFGLTDKEMLKWTRRQLMAGKIVKENNEKGRLMVQSDQIILIVDPMNRTLVTAYPLNHYGGNSDEILDIDKEKELRDYLQKPLKDYLKMQKQKYTALLDGLMMDLRMQYMEFQNSDSLTDLAVIDKVESKVMEVEDAIHAYQSSVGTAEKLINGSEIDSKAK
ncbi:hypothetical protein ACLUYC_08025 [Limosilactobacillus mucosae]